jgi:hypothetical protein
MTWWLVRTVRSVLSTMPEPTSVPWLRETGTVTMLGETALATRATDRFSAAATPIRRGGASISVMCIPCARWPRSGWAWPVPFLCVLSVTDSGGVAVLSRPSSALLVGWVGGGGLASGGVAALGRSPADPAASGPARRGASAAGGNPGRPRGGAGERAGRLSRPGDRALRPDGGVPRRPRNLLRQGLPALPVRRREGVVGRLNTGAVTADTIQR